MNPVQPCTPVVFTRFIVFNVRFVNLLPCYRDSTRSVENSGFSLSKIILIERPFDQRCFIEQKFHDSTLVQTNLNLVKLVSGVVFIGIQMFGYWSCSFFLFFYIYGTQKKKIEIDWSRDIKREKFNTKIGNRLIQISREASGFSMRRGHLRVSVQEIALLPI